MVLNGESCCVTGFQTSAGPCGLPMVWVPWFEVDEMLLIMKSPNAVVLSSTLKSPCSFAFRRSVIGRIDMLSAVFAAQTVPPRPLVAASELVPAGRTTLPGGQPASACALPPGRFQYEGASTDRPPGKPVKSWLRVESRSASVKPLDL